MKRAISIAITLLMLMSGMFVMINVSTGSENIAGISSAPGNNVPLLTSHVPIRINNDSDFVSQASSEGWNGSGTQADPYVIENYDIDGTNAGSTLYIGNTTAYFVVRNCSLHDASGNSGTYFWNSGVVLYNLTGGILENNTASNNDYGIYLSSSNSSNITNNTASANSRYGIYLDSSSNNTIANNNASSNNNYGIYLYQSSGNTIINNNASNNYLGIYLYSSDSNIITNNTASNNAHGIYLYSYSNNNDIINNTVVDNDYMGIELYYSQNDVLTGNIMINDSIFIYGGSLDHWNAHNIDTNNTVNGKPVYYWKNLTSGTVPLGAGEVILANCTGVTVENQNASDGSAGILMGFSSGNTIANNTASANSQYGMYIYRSDSNTIINNNASNNYYGIFLSYSDSNNITSNTASSNSRYGIYIYRSDSNTVSNNIVSNNPSYGVYLDSSQYDVLTGNTMINDGIFIYGYTLDQWNTHNIDTNNTVNGKSVYYWKNRTSGTVPTGAGEVILANCTGVTAENQNVSDGTVGIQLGFSSGNTIANNTASANSQYGMYIYYSDSNTIANNTASNNYYGIYTYSSDSNTIANNTVSNNNYGIYTYSSNTNTIANNTLSSNNNYGILFSSSDSNTIANNTVSNNNYGIRFYYCDTNTIANNTVSNNNYGIYTYSSNTNTIANNNISSNNNYGIWLYSSSSNILYHNNFISNIHQAYDNTGNNLWNLSYPEGGNYWSDYNGADSFSGPNQDILGSDGIGDTPYTNIGGIGQQDNYPLMYPTSSTPLFLGNTPWPMFRHDIFHTGISPYNSSAGAWLYWNFTTGGEISGSAAIADDGTIYTGSSDGKLYAINPDGTEKWNFAADGSINGSSPAIANDGTIYFGTMNGTLYALYPDGTEKWSHSIGSPILSSPVIGSDGTIYIGANDSKLYAIQQNGTEKWNYNASSNITNSPVIDQEGKIIFSTYNNYTYALNTGGSLSWSVDLHSNISASPLILDANGTYIVVIACMDGNLYGFNTTDGTFAGNVNVGAPISSTPVYKDPYLYVADENGTIHAFNTSNNMTEDWNFTTGRAIYSSPAIDARGNVFFGSADGKIYALSSSGSEVWNYTVGSPVNGSPAINDGMLYIGSTDNNLYAIGDTIAPSVEIDSPSDGAILNTSSVTVSWTGSDATSGINHYEVRIDGGSWTDVGTATSYEFTGLSDSSYTVDVKAVDNASNENTTSVTFTVDATPPQITITSPSDGAILNTHNVTVSWTGSDATSGIDHYEIRINSDTWIDVGTNTSYTFTGLSDDSYTVDLWTIDNADNENNTSVTFTVDATPPEITITSPSDGAIFNITNVTVSWTGSDATSGIDHYEIRINSGSWIDVGTDTSYTFTGLSDDSYTVEVKVIDNASNENDTSVAFTVDATPPEVTIDSPSDETILNTTTVTVSWTGSDVTTDIDHYEIRIDSGNWIDVGTDTSYTFTGLSDDSYTVDVRALDNAGNTNTATVDFTLDATPPTVVSHSPTGNDVPVDTVITVEFSEEMEHSSVHIEINGVTGTIAWNNNTATFTPSQNLSYDTEYTVHVTGSDLAGNAMQEYTWSFTTTDIGTIVGIVTDKDENPVEGATVTIDSGETATTDANGHFEIQAHAGNHTLTISKDGYETETRSTSVTPGEETPLPPVELPKSKAPANEFPWLYLILLIIIILAVVALLIAKRKKSQGIPQENEQPMEPTEETEEAPMEEENPEEIAGEAEDETSF